MHEADCLASLPSYVGILTEVGNWVCNGVVVAYSCHLLLTLKAPSHLFYVLARVWISSYSVKRAMLKYSCYEWSL